MTPDEAMRLGKALLVASQMPVCELPVNSVLFTVHFKGKKQKPSRGGKEKTVITRADVTVNGQHLRRYEDNAA